MARALLSILQESTLLYVGLDDAAPEKAFAVFLNDLRFARVQILVGVWSHLPFLLLALN